MDSCVSCHGDVGSDLYISVYHARWNPKVQWWLGIFAKPVIYHLNDADEPMVVVGSSS